MRRESRAECILQQYHEDVVDRHDTDKEGMLAGMCRVREQDCRDQLAMHRSPGGRVSDGSEADETPEREEIQENHNKELDQELEDDEITSGEAAFVKGYDQEREKEQEE